MTLDQDLATLRELVLLRTRLEAQIAATLPDVRAQIKTLQDQLDSATVNERAELLAATQYEEQIRANVSAAIENAWADRWAALGRGEDVPPLPLPSWLVAKKVTRVTVSDENLVPAEYRTIDLKAIKAAGVDVPGTSVTVGASISVLSKKI